jgi:hypothetical protein
MRVTGARRRSFGVEQAPPNVCSMPPRSSLLVVSPSCALYNILYKSRTLGEGSSSEGAVYNLVILHKTSSLEYYCWWIVGTKTVHLIDGRLKSISFTPVSRVWSIEAEREIRGAERERGCHSARGV